MLIVDGSPYRTGRDRKEKKMKRIFIPCSLLTIFVLSYVVFGQVEKGGIQDAIKLQSGGDHMNYVRAVDFAAIARIGPDERFDQTLFEIGRAHV
jgi:hypothetical protein